jgi:hypothetical protein
MRCDIHLSNTAQVANKIHEISMLSTVDCTGVIWLLLQHLLLFVLLTVHVNRSNSEKNGIDLNNRSTTQVLRITVSLKIYRN